jgi:hypothetical protein
MIWKEGILGKKLPMIFSVFTREWFICCKNSTQCVHNTWNKLLSNTEVYLFMYIFIYLFIYLLNKIIKLINLST